MERLCVVHFSKERLNSHALKIPHALESFFFIETCQRYVWVGFNPPFFLAEKMKQEEEKGLEFYWGGKAYFFLLRFATGLESQIIGETDVFGQIKQSWSRYLSLEGVFSAALTSWMKHLFEDTKRIRSQFLQNLGGTSYGSLVRKFLKEKRGFGQGPLFFLGAGQLARSVAPFLLDSDLWIWNRSQEHLETFTQMLEKRARNNQIFSVIGDHEEERAWKTAPTIVVCTPLDRESDVKKIKWLKQRKGKEPLLLHLGTLRESQDFVKIGWQSLSYCLCLDDLFDLEKSMKHVRSLQIASAKRACEERSNERVRHEKEVKARNQKVSFSLVSEPVGCKADTAVLS